VSDQRDGGAKVGGAATLSVDAFLNWIYENVAEPLAEGEAAGDNDSDLEMETEDAGVSSMPQVGSPRTPVGSKRTSMPSPASKDSRQDWVLAGNGRETAKLLVVSDCHAVSGLAFALLLTVLPGATA
jgi:hypothetical protein